MSKNSRRKAAGAQPSEAAVQDLVSLLNAGRSADAEKKTRKLIKKFPNAVFLFSILGVALANQGKFDGAASCHKRVLEVAPDYAEGHYNLGVALKELGRLEDARASFATTIKIKPSFTEAYNNLGIVLHQLGRLDEAAGSFRQALALRPDFAEVHFNLGKALLALERPEEALASCREALRIAPGLTDTRQILGQALETLGRLDEALKAFDEELKLQPDNAHVGVHRARVLEQLGQPEAALDVYDAVLRHDAALEEAHVQRALLLMELGRNDEARNALQAALSDRTSHSIRTIQALSQLPASMLDVDILAMVDDAQPDGQASMEDFDSMRAFIRAAELHKAGQFAEAWENLIIANRHRSHQKQDQYVRTRQERDAALAWLRNAPAAQPPDDVEGHPLSLHILGPSRSGKTTLEKLATLLDGTKLGFEDKIVRSALHQAAAAHGDPGSTREFEPSPAEDEAFRDFYFTKLENRAGPARIFTSTLPSSINIAYRMAAALPNSRFVFMQRDVKDTCLRIYMKMYTSGHPYAYDISNILEYVTWYNEMSGVLAERFPQISLAIRYEDMIAEPAAALQSVAGLCGTAVPKKVDLPLLYDDRGCAAPYKAFIDDAT